MQFLDFKHLDLALICDLSLPWKFIFIDLIRIVYYPYGFLNHFIEKVTIWKYQDWLYDYTDEDVP